MLLRHHQRLLQYQVCQDLETIHLPRLREWEFLVQWQDLETIHSMQLKAWPDLAQQDQARQDQAQGLKVDHQDQELDLPVQVVLVQDLAEQNQDLEAVLLPEDSQVEDPLVVAAAA
jgi:hypothetical protein